MTPIAIGGDDGIAIESGGLFQGYASSALDFYAFRKPGLVALAAGAPLIVAGDNSGDKTEASKTIEVESAWSLAGGELTIDYRVTDAGGQHDSRAVWSVGETTDSQIRRATEGTGESDRAGVRGRPGGDHATIAVIPALRRFDGERGAVPRSGSGPGALGLDRSRGILVERSSRPDRFAPRSVPPLAAASGGSRRL